MGAPKAAQLLCKFPTYPPAPPWRDLGRRCARDTSRVLATPAPTAGAEQTELSAGRRRRDSRVALPWKSRDALVVHLRAKRQRFILAEPLLFCLQLDGCFGIDCQPLRHARRRGWRRAALAEQAGWRATAERSTVNRHKVHDVPRFIDHPTRQSSLGSSVGHSGDHFFDQQHSPSSASLRS